MAVTEREREMIRQELLEEQRKERNAYQKEWRRKNPEKRLKQLERYYKKKLAELEMKEGTL